MPLVIAGLALSAAPESPVGTPTVALAAPSGATGTGQAPGEGPEGEVEPEEEQNLPVFQDTETVTPPDSGLVKPPGVPAAGTRPDSAAGLPAPSASAQPETLRYVPPGERPIAAAAGPVKGPVGPAPLVKKPRQGPLGIPPIFVLVGLAAVHVFVVRTVTD